MIEGLLALDRDLFLFINGFHSKYLNPVMQFLSGQLIWLPLIGFFLGWSFKTLGKSRTMYFLLFLFLTMVASDVTSSYILKNIFNRLRPCREIDLKPLIYYFGQKCGGKFGFVSSHAANSSSLILFSLISLKFKSRQYLWFLMIPFLVGFSRVYLGVHYPGDIIGGVFVGAAWAWVFSKMFKLTI